MEWKRGKVPPVPLDMSIGHLREMLAWCVGEVMVQLKDSTKMVTNLVESWPKSMGGDMRDPVVIAAGIENLTLGSVCSGHISTARSAKTKK